MEIQDFINRITKEFGEKVYVPLNQNKEFDVIPTSSIGLNIATRVGGIPMKAITEIFGREGSGKSTLSLDVAKNFLLRFPERVVLYVDVENMMTTEYIRDLLGNIVTETNFVLTQPLTSEDALMIAEKGIDSGIVGLVVIDSIGALAPKREVESDLDKESYSGSAKLIARFLRRIAPKINHNNVAVIAVNQVRDNVGSYVGGYSTPGGHSLKHFATLRIMLSDNQKIRDKDEIIGNTVKYIVKKNKLGSPHAAGEFPLIFGKGIDFIQDVIQVSNKLGIILRRGAYYYFEGEQLGQGLQQTIQKLSSDAATLDKIVEMCYNMTINRDKEVDEVE